MQTRARALALLCVPESRLPELTLGTLWGRLGPGSGRVRLTVYRGKTKLAVKTLSRRMSSYSARPGFNGGASQESDLRVFAGELPEVPIQVLQSAARLSLGEATFKELRSSHPVALMARIDVVVVTYNSRKHVRACVESLCTHPAISVIVVDNNSQDGTVETLAGLPWKSSSETITAASDSPATSVGALGMDWNVASSIRIQPTDVPSILALEEAPRPQRGDSHIGVSSGPTDLIEKRRAYSSHSVAFRRFLHFARSCFLPPRIRPTTRWSLDIADPEALRCPRVSGLGLWRGAWPRGGSVCSRRRAASTSGSSCTTKTWISAAVSVKEASTALRPSILRRSRRWGLRTARELIQSRLAAVALRAKARRRGGELSERFAAGLYALTASCAARHRVRLRAKGICERSRSAYTENDAESRREGFGGSGSVAGDGPLSSRPGHKTAARRRRCCFDVEYLSVGLQGVLTPARSHVKSEALAIAPARKRSSNSVSAQFRDL